MKALAAMCKAFLKIYEENNNLEKKIEQIQIDFPYEIEKRDKEICYLNALLAKSIQQSAKPAKTRQEKVVATPDNQEPEAGHLCEFCGKPVAKPTHRFCSTSCQVKFSHRQRGNNITDKPATKRRYSRRDRHEADTAPDPQPEATPQGATEEKGPDAGK
jgi:hypothetical protein